jgi:hypothetical protein
MDILAKHIPPYMHERANIARLVAFTAMFALVFINLYKPFHSGDWYNVSDFTFFISSSLITLTGMGVVIISRLVMYRRANRRPVTLGQYLLWIAAEILLMALFFTIYTLSVNNGERDAWRAFQDSVTNTALVILLPYTILHLYFSRVDKTRRLLQLQQTRDDPPPPTPRGFSFRDERGNPRLTVSRPALLYIESADNYVIICYLNKGKTTRFLLRATLKALEKQLDGADILRCHRSYMVNFEHVKVIRRDKDGLHLELDVEHAPDIPVSRTYSDRVSRWFSRYSTTE